MRQPLALAVGDPAGIGPMVSVEGALRHVQSSPAESIGVFGDAHRLAEEFRRAGVECRVCRSQELPHLAAGEVAAVHAATWTESCVATHAPSAEGGRAQLETLDAAIDAVKAGHARALVTGPTSKEAIVAHGVSFVGQTEHLARSSGLPDDAVSMLFIGPRLKVGLVTTHLSIARVPSQITAERVARTLTHLVEVLRRLGIDEPRVAVAGLNPHAGESGLFGTEEERVIAPALERLSLPARIEGPAPAEAVFRRAAGAELDGVVAMFHDQATIASKLLDWGSAVNLTWGLPFVRTSVDHGVAYDAARAGIASAEGMLAALRLASALCPLGTEKC